MLALYGTAYARGASTLRLRPVEGFVEGHIDREVGVLLAPGRRFTMSWLQGVAVMLLMLLLRLVVPVVITFAVGYALHRLDVKWHSETASMV